jgi:hypothetical protein
MRDTYIYIYRETKREDMCIERRYVYRETKREDKYR